MNNKEIVIKGLRIVNGPNGLFVSMPRYKNKNGEFKEIVFPITKEGRETIQTTVLEAFEAYRS